MEGRTENKLKSDFTNDGVDNTASVKSILNEFSYKNIRAFNYYNHLVRKASDRKQLVNIHYLHTGHPLYAFRDDWDGGLSSDYYEAFRYKSTMPKYITKLRYIDRTDPLTGYMKLKADWHLKLFYIYRNVTGNKSLQNYEVLNEDVVYVPKYYVDIATDVENDPDPYFDSLYNWYYAGNGNIQLITINGLNYLLHSEFNTLYISQFHKENLTVDMQSNVKFDCGNDINIFETICSTDNIVVLRTMNKIFILKIIENDEIQIEKLKVLQSKLPYTSINFDNHHKHILYVTSLDCKLIIVNLNRMVGKDVKLSWKIKSLVNNWSKVIGSDRVSYTHIGNGRITIYDKRTHEIAHKYKHIKNISDMNCNNISVAKQLENTNSLYFCTDHHLFLMDTRRFTGSKPKVMQRWTHGMMCQPTYINTCDLGLDKDMLCLSSQWCEDMCIVVNYKMQSSKMDMPGVTMPYRPPGVFKLLDEAKQKNLCCNIHTSIEKRLSTAITGNVLMERADGYCVLSHNSLGDMSVHILSSEHNQETFTVSEAIKHLDVWSKDYKIRQDDFEITSIVDISKIWKNLKKIPDSYEIQEDAKLAELKSKFNEKEIFAAFESEELDSGLLDVWINGRVEGADSAEQVQSEEMLSFAMHASGSDSE